METALVGNEMVVRDGYEIGVSSYFALFMVLWWCSDLGIGITLPPHTDGAGAPFLLS